MGEADRYDPNIIFNITSEDKEVSQQYLTPWTHSGTYGARQTRAGECGVKAPLRSGVANGERGHLV